MWTGGSAVRGLMVMERVLEVILVVSAIGVFGLIVTLVSACLIAWRGKTARRVWGVRLGGGLLLAAILLDCTIIRGSKLPGPTAVASIADLRLQLGATMTEQIAYQPELVTFRETHGFFRGNLEHPEFFQRMEKPLNYAHWGEQAARSLLNLSLEWRDRRSFFTDLSSVSASSDETGRIRWISLSKRFFYSPYVGSEDLRRFVASDFVLLCKGITFVLSPTPNNGSDCEERASRWLERDRQRAEEFSNDFMVWGEEFETGEGEQVNLRYYVAADQRRPWKMLMSEAP